MSSIGRRKQLSLFPRKYVIGRFQPWGEELLYDGSSVWPFGLQGHGAAKVYEGKVAARKQLRKLGGGFIREIKHDS